MALLAGLPKVCTCVTVVAVVTVPIPPVVEEEGAGGMVHAVGGPHFRKARQPPLALNVNPLFPTWPSQLSASIECTGTGRTDGAGMVSSGRKFWK